MLEWWYQAQLWFGVAAGLLLVLMGLIGRRPSGFSLALVAGSEFGLVVQLIASITLVILGERAKLEIAKVAAALRAAGVRTDLAYGDRGVKNAMRAADRSGARVALVAGDRDIEAGTVGVKDLSTGDQVDVAIGSVVGEVVSRLT